MTTKRLSRTAHPIWHPGINQGHVLASRALEVTLATPNQLASSSGNMSSQQGTVAVQMLGSSRGPVRVAQAASATQNEQCPIALQFWPSSYTLYTLGGITGTSGGAASGASTCKSIYGVHPTGSSTPFVGFDATTSTIVGVGALASNRTTGGVTVTPNRLYHCFLSHPGGLAAHTLEILGAGSSASATHSPSAITPSAPYVVVGNQYSTSSPGGKIFMFGAIFAGVLSADERALLASDPFALLAPRRRPIWLGGAAVVAFKPAWARRSSQIIGGG